MTVTIHYYQSSAVDANFRTTDGAHDKRLAVETSNLADIQFAPVPGGATFALIETDQNIRYTVTPASIEATGAPNLPDGTPKLPGGTSVPMGGAAFTLQGPVTCEGGDVVRVKTY